MGRWRDGDRLIGLPLINGDPGQHMNDPYYPAPVSSGVLAGSADATFPQLLPRLTLSDGSVLQPVAWFKDARVETADEGVVVDYRQDAMDLMGDNAPRPDARASATTRFDLRPGSVSRSDDIRLRGRPPPRSSWSSRASPTAGRRRPTAFASPGARWSGSRPRG